MNHAARAIVHHVNSCAVALQDSPRLGPLVRRRMTVVSYVGRRSGRAFSTPVAYVRTPDGVRINVAIPDTKRWWRNFTGAGGPLTVRLDGFDRPGHATAVRLNDRRAVVTVRFTGGRDDVAGGWPGRIRGS
ncbi:hypothetical protein [Catenuloplanes atrovinosus]|uniref:DUF385 domain-containing protein n=1 Tax=Catenuloplanes atrovinosus TaxID=137266 RepID=A0AAE3YND6_9ACTN|nr:hypothetical protein [Catenuloplanes atrovinosus]MDR7275388.1 hypothetical protein [Catenuloplanes atrovinosus]